jgi:hypothetical protein
MGISNLELCDTLRRVAEGDKSYRQALEIIKQNTNNGRIWLIGGFLYKTLANSLYGTDKPSKDFDFIIEHPNQQIVLPGDWQLNKSRFGNPKFTRTDKILEIDFVPLARVYSIMKRQISPTIQNYLSGVPLNIHCLVYEIRSGILEGDIGLAGLEQKVVRVHDLEMAEDAARWYDITVNEMITKKARELGFSAELVE